MTFRKYFSLKFSVLNRNVFFSKHDPHTRLAQQVSSWNDNVISDHEDQTWRPIMKTKHEDQSWRPNIEKLVSAWTYIDYLFSSSFFSKQQGGFHLNHRYFEHVTSSSADICPEFYSKMTLLDIFTICKFTDRG